MTLRYVTPGPAYPTMPMQPPVMTTAPRSPMMSLRAARPAKIVSGGYPAPTQASVQPAPAGGRAPIGSKLPPVEIQCGFPPEPVNIAERTAGKRVILVGLPGAFTPT
mmetsp:Transcript_62313/g.114794  ORF Transcript_62313/g.114794 Transcript_62313/m.114794 type:complete len:107 (+) Transcript_62313:96-416(+)